MDQLSYLSSNDIVIFDRWYYSDALFDTLNKNNIGYMFRMKCTSNFFKGMNIGKSKIIDYRGNRVQLFKYKIKEEYYYMLTSITEKISVNEIKALYQKRWRNETDNKKYKYDVLNGNIRSKKYNSLLVDIETIRYISTLSSLIECLGVYTIFKKIKIHTNNCLYILYNKLLRVLMYAKNSDKYFSEVCRIFGIIYKTVTQIVPDRHNIRRKITPHSKWGINGNRYGNGGKKR